MTKAVKWMTETEKFQRELAKIDRRLQDERTTPEQRQELWQRRRELFGPKPGASGK